MILERPGTVNMIYRAPFSTNYMQFLCHKSRTKLWTQPKYSAGNSARPQAPFCQEVQVYSTESGSAGDAARVHSFSIASAKAEPPEPRFCTDPSVACGFFSITSALRCHVLPSAGAGMMPGAPRGNTSAAAGIPWHGGGDINGSGGSCSLLF